MIVMEVIAINRQFLQKGIRILQKKVPILRGKKKTLDLKNIIYHSEKSFKGSMVEKLLKNLNVENMRITNVNGGIDVTIFFKKSKIEYNFKYNKDGLLLLRGATRVEKPNKKINILSPNSISDFAISARIAGEDCHAEWVPVHGRNKGVSLNPVIKIIINGISQINPFDNFKNAHSFRVVQSFYAINFNTPKRIMWKHYISHCISLEHPYCEIENKIEIMNDTEIRSMYLTMLPAESTKVSRLFLNNGMEFTSIPNDGTDLDLENKITSAIYLGRNKDENIHACAVDSLFDLESNARVTFREDNVTKFYLNHFSGIAKKGEIFQNIQRIMCINNIRTIRDIFN